jgi:hypothetical protein
MTLMDMGKTELKFEPIGGGYAASVQSFDMSGQWELTVDAVQGAVQVHKTVHRLRLAFPLGRPTQVPLIRVGLLANQQIPTRTFASPLPNPNFARDVLA